ncbi:MAG: hypothetical protein R3Y59_04760 [bacterium]
MKNNHINNLIIAVTVVILSFSAHINIAAQMDSYNDSIFHTNYSKEQIKDSTLLDKVQYALFQSRALYLQEKYDDALLYLLDYTENNTVIRRYPKEYANMIYMLSRLCVKKSDYENSYYLLNIAHEYNPDNTIYLSELAWFNLNIDEFDKAIVNYNKLIKLSPYKSDYYYGLYQAYKQKNNYKKAYEAIEKYEELEGESVNLLSAKVEILMQYKKLNHVVNIVNNYPVKSHDDDIAKNMLLAEIYNDKNMTDNCLGILLRTNEKYPHNPVLLLTIAQTYKTIDDDDNQEKYTIEAVMCSNINPSKIPEIIRPTIAGMIQDERNNEINILLDKIYNNNTQDSVILRFKYDVEIAQKDTLAARNTLYKIREIYTHDQEIEKLLLDVERSLGNNDDIIKISAEGWDKYKTDIWALYKTISYLYDTATYNTAFSIGIELVDSVKDKNIKGRMYSILGNIASNKQDYTTAIELFEKCLQYTPDEAEILNNLAYYIALHGNDIKRAEQLAAKALESNHENVNTLDTYAWILYLQNDYRTAKFYYDKILRIHTAQKIELSAEALYHYGAILKKCNMEEEGNRFWIKAIESINKIAQEDPETAKLYLYILEDINNEMNNTTR